MKLKEVIQRNQQLNTISDKRLPVKISYAIAKNAQTLQKEAELIEKERIKLLEQYAEKDEDGNPKTDGGNYVLGDNMEKYTEEYKEYLDTDVEVDIHKFPETELDKLDDPRYDVLTATELAALEFMLEN